MACSILRSDYYSGKALSPSSAKLERGGRGSPRQGIRWAADAPVDGVHASPRRAGGRSLAFLLVQSVLQVLGPLLTKIAVDTYLRPDPARMRTRPLDAFLPADPYAGLARIGLMYLACSRPRSCANSGKPT